MSEISTDISREPALVSISVGRRDYLGGKSRAAVYRDLGEGKYKAVKDGKRIFLVVQSLKDHVAALPAATIKPSTARVPSIKSEPRRKKQQRQSKTRRR